MMFHGYAGTKARACLDEALARPGLRHLLHDATPVVYQFTLDTKAPGTKAKGKSVKVEFSSKEGGAKFECKLGKGEFKRCKSPKIYRRPNAVRVRAIDRAGNVDRTPAKAKLRKI